MPEWKPEILRRLAPLNLAPTREAEIADELSQHLEDRYREILASGQSEEAAFRTTIDELKGEDLLARGLKPVERSFYREPIAPGRTLATSSQPSRKTFAMRFAYCVNPQDLLRLRFLRWRWASARTRLSSASSTRCS
ncbi:MAG: permease prefix domain 1-containing protein [Candidatus Acidiferrales bacterium]